MLKPDLALTFDQATTDILTTNGIPNVMLRVQNAEEAKDAVTRLSDLFGMPEARPRYTEFFDKTLAGATEKLASVPVDARPRVLSSTPRTCRSRIWWPNGG